MVSAIPEKVKSLAHYRLDRFTARLIKASTSPTPLLEILIRIDTLISILHHPFEGAGLPPKQNPLHILLPLYYTTYFLFLYTQVKYILAREREMMMEQQQLEYLKTWKQELEKENQEFLSDLRKYNKERDELLTKRSFLTELKIQPINGDSIDDVNLYSGYDEFDGRLRDLQSDEQHKFEKKLESKIDYNKIIIRRINLYLP